MWWVLLDGTISLVRRVGSEETVLGAMANPGQWAGGFGAWDEHGIYFATGRGAEPGRVFTAVRGRAAATWRTGGSPSA